MSLKKNRITELLDEYQGTERKQIELPGFANGRTTDEIKKAEK